MTHRQWRLLLGPIFVALIVGILAFDRTCSQPLVSPLIMAALGLGALAEALGMSSGLVRPGLRRTTFVAGALLLLGTPILHWAFGGDFGGLEVAGGLPLVCSYAALLTLALAAVWVGSRRSKKVEPADLAGYATALALGIVVVVPLFCLQQALFLFPEGELFVLALVLGAKLNDMGGYLVGSAIGKHKLCPGVSPNKSIEGSVAGLLAGIAGTAWLVTLFDHGSAPLDAGRGALLGLALGVTTQLSDLFESGIKRSVGVKDSSTLVPAFGGVFDMVDSLIFAAPVGYTLGALWLA